MTHEESNIWKEKTIEATCYRDKLRRAREQKGWTEHETAAQMELVSANYYDIEGIDGNLTYNYSLNEILRICAVLDIHPRDLFCDQPALSNSTRVTIVEVIDGIKNHCAANSISVIEFEDIAGWRVENCLTKPTAALDEWNIDCLMDVCRETRVDWRAVITGL